MRAARRHPSKPPTASAAHHPRSSGARTSSRPFTVLVVDDVEDNRELFAAVLRERGFVVTTANDGLEALDAAARHRPNVVFMDLMMPRMDGLDAIERLRLEDHGRAAFIVVVSALSDLSSRRRAQAVGADAFLSKPCAPRDLVALVERASADLHPPAAVAG